MRTVSAGRREVLSRARRRGATAGLRARRLRRLGWSACNPLRRLTVGFDRACARPSRDEGRASQDARRRDAERIVMPDVESCSGIVLRDAAVLVRPGR